MLDIWRQIWAGGWRATRGIAPRLGWVLVVAALPAAAQEPVSLELVLAVDVSISVNDIEFQQQKEGMAFAFRDPEVVELILSRRGGVAVQVTLWGGFPSSDTPNPWRLLRTEGDIQSLASGILTMKRENLGYLTALGSAMSYAIRQIETNDYEGLDKKIDVSGDGKNNSGPDPRHARAEARDRGITINGLAIGNAEDELLGYYERNVMTGPDAFVEYAADFEMFAEVFRRKLRRELMPKLAGGGTIRRHAGLPR